MNKHTPGPWEVGKIYTSRNKEFIPVNVKSENCVYTIINTVPLKNNATDEDKANAKLIAAAPDMFEIVKELYDWAIKNETYGRIFPKIEAAYKKATEYH